LGLTAWNKMQV